MNKQEYIEHLINIVTNNNQIKFNNEQFLLEIEKASIIENLITEFFPKTHNCLVDKSKISNSNKSLKEVEDEFVVYANLLKYNDIHLDKIIELSSEYQLLVKYIPGFL